MPHMRRARAGAAAGSSNPSASRRPRPISILLVPAWTLQSPHTGMADAAQPAPSWAQLNSQLSALLRRLEGASALADIANVADAAADWHDVVAAAVEGTSPDGAARDRLARSACKCMLGQMGCCKEEAPHLKMELFHMNAGRWSKQARGWLLLMSRCCDSRLVCAASACRQCAC